MTPIYDFTSLLEDLTDPDSIAYLPVQVGGISLLTYAGAKITRSFSKPFLPAVFLSAAFLVSQATKPIFAYLFHSVRHFAPARLLGKVVHIVVSLAVANLLLAIVDKAFTLQQILKACAIFLLMLTITKLALRVLV